MPTLAAGRVVSIVCPTNGQIAINPGLSGRVSLNARGMDGSQSIAPREIYSAETISVSAGDTVILEAINTDATYGTLVSVDAGGASLEDRLNSRTAVFGSVGDSITAAADSYIRRAVYALAGTGAYYDANAAVSGAKTAAMLAQFATLPPWVNVVTMMGGSNDAINVSWQQHIANIRAVGDAAVASGRTFVLIACPPMDTLTSTINSYQYPEMALCRAKGWDYYDPWQRVAATTGGWVGGASSDGTHPNAATHLTAAADLAAAIVAGRAAQYGHWPRGPGDGIDPNPLFVTDSNADNVPDGLSVLGASSPTYSLTNATYPQRGKIWEAQFSQSTTVDAFREWSLSTYGISVGEDIEIAAWLEVAALSNCRVRCWVERTGVTGDTIRIFLHEAVTSAGRWVGGVMRVPTGCTKLTFWIRCESAAGGAFTATVRLGAVNAYRYSAVRAAIA